MSTVRDRPELDETAREAALREQLRDVLEQRYGLLPVDASGRPERQDDRLNQAGAESLDAVIELQRLLYDSGLAGFGVPAELGGHGLSTDADRRLQAEIARYRTPDMTPLAVGLHLVVPTIINHGSPEQRAQHVTKTLRADEVWCQLFSEPGAGSDLASMQTRAVRDGDEFIVNGQKVWTSWGRQAAYGILMARTDPDVPKHRGISMFLLDMSTPGVEARPLREMTGGWQFCEVFFTDVRIPAACLVAEINTGWAVAMSLLTNERSEGALRSHNPRAPKLIQLAKAHGSNDSPAMRQRLVDVYIREAIVLWLAERITSRAVPGSALPDVSLVKVMSSQIGQAVVELQCELVGPASIAWDSADEMLGLPAFELAYSRMGTIAGGTNEIQRNILGERVLGLPRDPEQRS